MKKQLRKSIAFFLATVMALGVTPLTTVAYPGGELDDLQLGLEVRYVPSSAIPALVHGNVPFATNGTRFVSQNYVNARATAVEMYWYDESSIVTVGRNNPTYAYQSWRYLRLDFSGSAGVSP